MDELVFCSLCFMNIGLRREAEKYAEGTDDVCANCGKRGGAKLDKAAAEELFRNFYCRASQAARYLPQVFVEGGDKENGIRFEESAQTDLEVLQKISGVTLRRNTPDLPLLGLTEIRLRIDEILAKNPHSAPEADAALLRQCLRRLMEAGSEYELQNNEFIYRARISPAHPLEPCEYDAPPVEKAKPNRIAGIGDRVFCGASSIETCIIEIRPHIDDLIHNRIFVASLKPNGRLKLIDFTHRPENSNSPELDCTLQAFFEANPSSYHLTQLLSSFAKRHGYDGILYPSAMECIAGNKDVWRNVALFDAPISEGKLRLQSINRVLIRNVVNNFDLGPAWEDGSRGNHLAPFLQGWRDRARR